jgi:AmmeMemoRadiSam system protein B
VAPHAGYVYSGRVAGRAFALMPANARVAILGPSHFFPLDGLAVSEADVWATPLGEVAVAGDLRETAVRAGATVDELPHERDHALEVELPFLQRTCPDSLEVLPIAVGRASPQTVAAFLAALDTLVVVSTDLSHYHPAARARELDRRTADAVLARDVASIAGDSACGVHALRRLVAHARAASLEIELLDLRTSADTAGDPESVVGYGAFAVGVA